MQNNIDHINVILSTKARALSFRVFKLQKHYVHGLGDDTKGLKSHTAQGSRSDYNWLHYKKYNA